MPAIARPQQAPLSLLIVDDNADAAASLAMLLEFFGHRVQTCSDGFAALAAARERHFDAFILDIGLPRLDGYGLARALREHGPTRFAVIVALSGYGSPEDRRRSADAGFDRHFVKPVEVDVLMEYLQALCKRSVAREGAVSRTTAAPSP